MTIALRYRRVSGLGQEDNSSLEKQLERMDDYCSMNGYESTPEYLYTEVMTGVETWRERPELQKMLSKAEQLSKLDENVVVLVDHPDRFARGMDLILLVELLLHYGVHCEFVQTKFEDTDEGHLVLHLESYSSKKEWNRIKKRTEDGRRDRVTKDHKLLGLTTPLYGYRFSEDKTHYEYHEEERKVIERIFQMIKDGFTLRYIANTFTEEGIPTRRGNPFWRGSSIGAIAGNIAYTGKYYALRETYKRNGQKWLHKEKPIEEQYLMPEGTCPPIIDEETFAIVQRQLTYNKEKASRNNKHQEDALLRAGYARCGYCGNTMIVGHNPSRNNIHQYRCGKVNYQKGGCVAFTTIGGQYIDGIVWDEVTKIIRNPQQLQKKIEALRIPDPTEKEEIPIEIQKKQIEDEISEYVDLLHTSKKETTKQNARGWISHLEEQLTEIEEKENFLLGIRNNWAQAMLEIKRFENWCFTWKDKLDEASYEDRRTCLRHLGLEVTIFKYGERPRWKIDYMPPNVLEKLMFVSRGSCSHNHYRIFSLTIEDAS